jgi:hypothetical protein
MDPSISSAALTHICHGGRRLQRTLDFIRSGPAAATAASLVLAGCFGDGQDHLLLYFRLVAWGLLAWIE